MYVAWTTTGSDPYIIAVGEDRKDAEEAGAARFRDTDIVKDIYAQTEYRNLLVESKSAFIRRFGTRAFEYALDRYLCKEEGART